MPQFNSDSELVPLLPQLKADADVKIADSPGKWDSQESATFENIAKSLDYRAPGAIQNVSSVPTMWARPLIVEMALHNLAHPLHAEMVEQWQGMLAAIALAEFRGFPLTVQLLKLNDLTNEEFARSLVELAPDYQENALYSSELNENPWYNIFVFLWNNKPVGITSPSTLVVPSEEGEWTDLPWWTQKNGVVILQSPRNFLEESEQALLWRWLENLNNELQQHNGVKQAINRMRGLVADFQSILDKNDNQPLSLSDNPQFFEIPINIGVLKALNRPVKETQKPSFVIVILSDSKKDNVSEQENSIQKSRKPPLIIIDPHIAEVWNIPKHKIWVHGGKTLASLPNDPEELDKLKSRWRDEVIAIEPRELFLENLVFLEGENALPGGLIPKTSQPLLFNNGRITPLIPLNPVLLDYFTAEDLANRIEFQPLNTSEGSKVRVILDLPLTGINNGKPPENYRLVKDYPLHEDNLKTEPPVLEIWPNFQIEGWQEYYTFYYDREYQDFKVKFSEAREQHHFNDEKVGSNGNYEICSLKEFPSFIECQNFQDETIIGLILLKAPVKIRLQHSWQIGVDFGTSFTNVFVTKGNDLPNALDLESLLLQVIQVNPEERRSSLYEYFIPEDFIPENKPPLSTVLTTRESKSDIENNPNPQAIYDGRIYVPDKERFETQEPWIKTNLKWSKTDLDNELFVKHLALHITAIAAQQGVKAIQWSLSYPSAFSRNERNSYVAHWRDVTDYLNQTTKIEHNCPMASDTNYFRTESVAIAQYFAEMEKSNLVNTTCIDLGGGTSDISIWENNDLKHQCSVKLGGRDIFSQFLAMNPEFLEKRFKVNSSGLKNLQDTGFNATLDLLLRLDGENWLRQKDRVQGEDDVQSLIRLTAIAIAGLYYYVGILLKVLYSEGKYNRGEITPVYIGGNGSRFLNWLAERGRFNADSEINELLSRMLSRGSGFEDTKEETRLSKRPKDEVAAGLLLNSKKLTGWQKHKSKVITGEDCLINGKELGWDARLELPTTEDVKEFKVPHLLNLSQFLYEFHQALGDLDIEIIQPLPDYQFSPDREANSKLWRDTEKELTNLLLDIQGNADTLREEPPFILGLKALLKVLGSEWAKRC